MALSPLFLADDPILTSKTVSRRQRWQVITSPSQSRTAVRGCLFYCPEPNTVVSCCIAQDQSLLLLDCYWSSLGQPGSNRPAEAKFTSSALIADSARHAKGRPRTWGRWFSYAEYASRNSGMAATLAMLHHSWKYLDDELSDRQRAEFKVL